MFGSSISKYNRHTIYCNMQTFVTYGTHDHLEIWSS